MPFHTLLDNYLAVFLAVIVGFILVATALIAARVLAPYSKEKGKSMSYECGMVPIGQTRSQFHVRFYLFAILFLIFDVRRCSCSRGRSSSRRRASPHFGRW